MPYATLQDCQDEVVTVLSSWASELSEVSSLNMTIVVIENKHVREQQRLLSE